VLLGWSVAGMAWTMLLNGDPDAFVAMIVGFTGISAAGTVFAYFLYRPLFRNAGVPRPTFPRKPSLSARPSVTLTGPDVPGTFEAIKEQVVAPVLTAVVRRLGIVSATGTVVLSVVYAIPLIAGLLSLPSPDAPIGDPWFPMMEILIILTMPLMVGMMVAVHAWPRRRPRCSVSLRSSSLACLPGSPAACTSSS
jgi:hypothetical protein